MKNLTYILVLLGCVFILSNCNTGCDEVITVNLKDLHKYVPYTGTETLRFLHNSTDTQTFVGQGMERFYVAYRKQEDGACREDHESVRIRFVNPKTQNEIKMEYVYDRSFGSQPPNPYTSYKFYYNKIFSGKLIDIIYPTTTMEINGYIYNSLSIFSLTEDTSTYVLYRYPYNNQYGGILKFKYPSDTLTLLR